MKWTTKYQLGYFEENDYTVSSVELQRWETLDAQLYSLFAVLGNGIISGWTLLASSGLSVAVAAGSGHVNFVSVKSTSTATIYGLLPSSRSYIYAALQSDSYWTQNVSFVARTTIDDTGEILYLGYVDTSATAVTDVNTDGRTNLGFLELIQSLIAAHRHIGGENNPNPINLATDVQGILNQRSIPPLDASVIQTGVIDTDRLPLIDHITQLINQGTLTHAQLDSFVEALNITGASLMGETSTVDLLQLILALKHVYPDIDRYLINEIAYIPGISPDTYVDWDNTTATVDIKPYSDGGQHTITGASSPGKNAYTYTWDNETEFEDGTHEDVIIDGDTVSLDTQVNTLVIDTFNDLTQWEVITNDLSSLTIALSPDASTYVLPPNSAKLVVGDTTVEIALVIKKEFDAQDWSTYNKIVLYLKTESVQHGDVYFYINDNFAGTQNSHTKVLSRNVPTINVDTLQNGWQEITVDISSYTRTNINTIGFYVSSQDGWDTSTGFDLNLDNIYLTNGNVYKENGYCRVVFGNDFFYDFWRVRWDAEIPTDIQSAGLVFKVRTRVGNTLEDLAQSAWSAYTSTSGSDISLPAPSLYKYIEIEAYFEASTDLTRSAVLRALYLDYDTSDVENSFNYDTQDEWDSGSKFNIDTTTDPGSMLISHTDEIDHLYYGTQSSAFQLDENLVTLYQITGSMLPRSTYQSQNDLSPSLGLVTGVSRGNDGNIWVSDTDNDRVVELDKGGGMVRAFYGTFLSTPADPYGVEDAGPGSNTNVASVTTTTTTIALNQTLNVLQAIYNPSIGVLYIVFNSDLENIYDPTNTLDIDKMYLKIGSQKFYLNDSTVELLGVERAKYELWAALASSTDSSAQFINQFSFSSHTLKITLNGADKTQLNYMVDQEAPSIVISSPYEQQRLSGTTTTIKFLLYNFTLGTGGTGNYIRVTLDSSVVTDTRETSITYSGLGNGSHTIMAQLVNADDTLNTNIEAIAESSFVVYNGTYSSPYVSIQSPKPNQIYSSSPVVVEFNVENFPILATGQHLRYIVDTDAPIDYYSELPITVNDLEAGQHTVKIYLVDSRGNDLGYTYGSATVQFIVGVNSNAVTKLYIDPQAIYNASKSLTTGYVRQYVDVGNVYFANIYSPIDVQVIPSETSIVNPSGLPTILMAKLRSQSWTNALATSNTQFVNAIASAANTSSTNTSSIITTSIAEIIYGTRYLDGHSVVQLNMSGETIFSNNAAIFAHTKEDAKKILGSAEKLGDNEILIGDSVNKRAIITYTNLSSQVSQIEWQRDSDRYVPDFHIIVQDDVTIQIRDDAISPAELFVRQGTNVIFENDSASPVTVYSGTTTYSAFQLDPDLTLYGTEFESSVLQPGERYTFKFVTVGSYDWFIYPSILTASVNVTRNRISSTDQYIILENDGLESPFSSRVIKVDSYGNTLWSFGESYLVLPRDARPLLNGGVLIST